MSEARANKISQLVVSNNISNSDIILIVRSPGNNATTNTITLQSFANAIVATGAPANSTANGYPGQMLYSGNFLYVCVANNLWQRSVLSSF